jgi:uncharacterized protein YggE
VLTDIRSWLIATAMCVAAPTTSLGAQATAGREHATLDEPVIEVSGHGETRVAPDRATVSLSVETKGPAAATVAAANARAQRRVLDTLKALGYSGAQVSTVGYNVQPNYEPVANMGQPKQAGYVSRNTVQVTVTQLDRVGPLIDAALARGANGVQGIAFDASNTVEPRQIALAQAVTTARRDATGIAKSMGGTLGRLVSISTQEPDYSRDFMARTRVHYDLAAETPINPGEITVEASVIARWQFVAP